MESPSENSACNDDPSAFEGPFFDRAEEIDAHKNHLPHWQQGDVWEFVTWRLNDSLPKWKVNRWKEERKIWLKSWKGFSAKTINNQIGRTGQLWQPDYWDRLIRSSRHFEGCLKYIRKNPGKALLHAGQFLLFENPKWGRKEIVGKEP